MTVKELIACLTKFHEDVRVVVATNNNLSLVSSHIQIEQVCFGTRPLSVIYIGDGSCTKP